MVRLVLALALALAVLGLAVSGCTTVVAGSAMPDAGAAKEAAGPLTASQALGEPRTIDYCSALESPPLPTDLGQIVDKPRRYFEYCRFTVRTKDATAGVRVGYLGNADTMAGIDRREDTSRTPPRGLTVYQGFASEPLCVRYLRFTDDKWLTVRVFADVGKGDWCRIADATVDSVIRRTIAKQVKHVSFGDKSLGTLEACDLLPITEVGRTLDNTQVRRSPTGHSCAWGGSGPADSVVRVHLGAERSPYSRDVEENLGDRHTRISSLDAPDFSLCTLETEHINSPDVGEPERAQVEVQLTGFGKDACGPGRDLAKTVWAKLPSN